MRWMVRMASGSESKDWVNPTPPPAAPIGSPAVVTLQRRVSGWYARRWWRLPCASRRSYQYHRSRVSSTSVTKNIGIPLCRASSTMDGNSTRMPAVSNQPDSLRSRKISCSSMPGA